MAFLRRAGLGACLAVVWLCVPPSLAANDDENWNRCLNQDEAEADHLTPDDVIAACRLVMSGMSYSANIRADAFNNIGAALTRSGRFAEAIRYYGEALRAIRDYQSDPEYRTLANYTLRNRAFAYAHLKQYEEALVDFDLIVTKEPIPRYYALRCKARALWAKDFASALPDCRRAIDADTSLTDAYAGRMIVSYRQGKIAEMLADCTSIAEKGAFAPEISYVCGLAERRAGDTKRGQALMAQAIIAMPGIDEVYRDAGIQ